MSKVLEFKSYDNKLGKYRNSGKFEIKNLTSDSAELYIYGDIVSSEWSKWEDTDIAPDDIKNFLEEIDGVNSISIYINSGGGSVFAGMSIYNMLKRNNAYKTVYVDGLAGSISSVIAMVGDKIIIPSNSYLMIHHALAPIMGNSIELRKLADTLDRIDEGILEVYKTKLKENINIEDIKEMIDKETWLTGKMATEFFDIEVTEELQAIAYTGDLSKYKNTPKNIHINEISIDDTKEKIENSKEDLEKLKAKLLLELEI